MNDFITLASGRLWSPMFLESTLYRMSEILLHQAIQERPGELHLKIVPSKKLSGKDKENITSQLQKCLPEPMSIEIESVESIPFEKSGKIKTVISKVKL
jgi:phenylacetate-coenzyme A ligase PaaK-like adenylate-forming protein